MRAFATDPWLQRIARFQLFFIRKIPNFLRKLHIEVFQLMKHLSILPQQRIIEMKLILKLPPLICQPTMMMNVTDVMGIGFEIFAAEDC